MSVSGAPPREGFSGMKLPSLIKQLKVVLDQYPDDGQILKELIQNAEDASAKVMKILYNGKKTEDQVSLTDDLPHAPHLKSLKGPGLCVFNDAEFEAQDWEGIRMIQSSVKEHARDKVGKFGLGFKSVFHLTDVPLVISGGHVLLIDPHIFDDDPNKVCFMMRLDSVGEFEMALLQVLGGTFGFSEETLRSGYYNGTLFWFPLRSKATVLSDNIYDAGKMEDLLKAFKEEAPHMMLFLKSLTRIEVYQKSASLFGKGQGDEMTHLMTVGITSGNQQDNITIRSEFTSVIKKHKGGLPKVPDERRYYLSVSIDDCMSEYIPIQVQTTWLVLQYYSSDKVSKSFKRLCSDPTISSSPCVGLAVNLDKDEAGHIFCFLPLPLEEKSPTGLPVHVHGHFALSQNRRHLKWPTADQKKNRAQTDKPIRWNQCLLQEAFPHAYANLIEEMITYWKHSDKDEEFVQRIYKTMPVVSEVTDQWQGLCKAFFKELIGRNCLYTPHNDRWISLHEAVFLPKECSQEVKDTILLLYTACQRNIVDIPAHLQETLLTFYEQPDGQKMSDLTFVNEKSLCDLFKSNTFNMTREQKLVLLQYICRDGAPDCLNGTQLLPLADGSFAAFGQTGIVFLCPPDDIAMFPGLDHQFVLSDENTEQLFLELCDKGFFNLKRLTPPSFCKMLRQALALNPGLRRLEPASTFNKSWLMSIWNYITENDIDIHQEFLDLPLIPVETDNNETSILYPLSTRMICAQVTTVGHIDQHLSKALRYLGVVTLPEVPDILKKNPSVMGNIIKYPSVDGLLHVLEEVAKKPTMVENIAEFNMNASSDEKSSLLGFLRDCQVLPESTMQLLRRLNLFSSTENDPQEMCKCINDLNISEPEVELPVSYPAVYLRCDDEQSERLSHLLGAQQAKVSYVILDILRKMKEGNRRYSKDDIEQFMFYLMEDKENYLSESKIRKSATDVKFIRTKNSNDTFKAKSLFFPDKVVCKLFLGQDVFPDDRFLKSSLKEGLKLIGLRTAEDITAEDLCEVGSHIEQLIEQKQIDQAVEKGQSLLTYLKHHINQLSIKSLKSLRYVRFVPCKVDKSGEYPQTLKLHAQECSTRLARPENVWSSRYLYILGSVSLVAKDISENVLKAFNVPLDPPLDMVLDHLDITIKSYKETDDVQDKYSRMMRDIYSYLSKIKTSSLGQAIKERLSQMRFIFSPELGFQFGRNIWIKKSRSDLDVKPYRFCLPKLLQQMDSMVLLAGGEQSQSEEMWVDVLRDIKEKHDDAQRKHIDLSEEIQDDLRIILQIVTKLKDLSKKPVGILLPIHQDESAVSLRLKPITECTYCNADWLKDQTGDDAEEEDGESLFFVHKNISEDTALELGITSLTDRVMDGTEKIDLNYGQIEPLTQRLHNILKGYGSSSIPKEMIQNAEDAKATKVIFLYDERKNYDARTSLMNESMASVQGPALWVYNDAKFSDDDFSNIQKLGGATKENDQTKIGWFGLGFNSVYNLTDVPSFISGKNVVIFDPHQSHLGKPGIKADLTSVKNRRMLQTMKGQFKPFDGILGCHIEALRNEDICDGTLFRFPLRTQEQAEISKISDLYYTPSEMKTFLQGIAKTAGNLLMFTHHVKVVKIYHLKRDRSPPDYQVLLTVTKDLESQHYTSQSGRELSMPNSNPLTFLTSKQDETESGNYMQERAGITLTTTEAFQRFDVQQQNERINWHITWSLEKDSSSTFNEKALKGLLPLAATAVCLKDANGSCSIGCLSSCPNGFFSRGQLFSVFALPLPPTALNMHVSAQFAMSDDRQHLCEQEDDSKRGRWNKHLETFVISRTIVSTLKGIGKTVGTDLESYFMLWPTVTRRHDQGHDLVSKPDIAKAFYKLITSEKHAVFPSDSGEFVYFEDTTLLDPSLAFDGQVGEIATRILKKYWKQGQVVELPEYIFKEFKSAGEIQVLKRQIMNRKRFYEVVFLPNMHQIPPKDCHMLIKYGLNKSDPALDDLLKWHACIPSKPYGTLKRPNELVHPQGPLSKLFMDEDECFPDDFFGTSDTLEKLVSLGMRTVDLSWEDLLARILTIPGLFERENDKAYKRCLYVLQYLNGHDHQTRSKRFTICPELIRDKIKDTHFLPVLQKSAGWPYKWASASQPQLSKPDDLFFDNAKNVVGSLHLILDSYCLQGLFAEKEVLEWLGVHDKASVPMKDAVDQLLHISLETSQGMPISGNTTNILHDLYRHLNSLCSSGMAHDLMEALRDKQIILHNKVLICPNQAAFHLGFDLEPFLFQIEHSQQNQFTNMLQAMGVEKTFAMTRVKKELNHLSEIYRGKCMDEREVRVYINMVMLWLELLKESKDDEIPQVMLPDSENYLKDSSSLCLDDCDWVSSESEMKFVHPTVSRDVALKLKVHTKMHANLKSVMREKLTRRLKGILEGYPKDSSIMKELLQNADDAGATELIFIKDFREHPTERIFDDTWKPMQGPALCVWNNKGFTEDDIEGIQALREGSKSEDPLKTGQYGVGFNAVYHITDAPSFLTVGPEIPESLCIFDPNLQYISWADETSPGCQLETNENSKHDLRDIFGCYIREPFERAGEGTMFRLPLRTKEMALTSEISNEHVDEDGINNLLNDFEKDMKESLLFLHNIRNISIKRVTKDGRLVEEFSVTAVLNELDEKKLAEHKQTISRAAAERKELQKQRSEKKSDWKTQKSTTEVTLTTKDNSGSEQSWIVVHQFGFAEPSAVPDIIQNCIEDGTIGNLPRGGVAVPKEAECRGKIFCILPLRLNTGLPIHVNGHFALDNETRGNLWHGPHRYRTDWNETIIKQVIVPSYLKALEKHSSSSFGSELTMEEYNKVISLYYRLFPLVERGTDNYWELLSSSFYEQIINTESKILPVVTPNDRKVLDLSKPKLTTTTVTIELVSPTGNDQGIFNTIPQSDDLVKILKDLGMKVLDCPYSIHSQFLKAGFEEVISVTTPGSVMQFLKTFSSCKNNKCQLQIPSFIKETPLKTEVSVLILTRYCQSEGAEIFLAELHGLPLLLTQDSVLRCFDSNNPTIVTLWPDLVRGSPERSIHQYIAHSFMKYFKAQGTPSTIQRLDIQTFSTFLPTTFPHFSRSTRLEWHQSEDPSQKWIAKVWDFLQEEITASEKQPDAKTIMGRFQPIKHWCLLPVVIKHGHKEMHNLYPISEAENVLNLQLRNRVSKLSCLANLGAPILEPDTFHGSESLLIAKEIVSSEQSPLLMVKAIANATTNELLLDRQAGNAIMKYICNNIECFQNAESVPLLRRLAIFEDLSGTMTNVSTDRVVGVKDQETIPKDGMALWSSGSGIKLLKCSETTECIFGLLHIEVLTPGKLYQSFILPKFLNLPKTSRTPHLLFIRDHLLHKRNPDLIKCLRDLPFIEGEDGSMHKAEKYFSKDEPLFRIFVKAENFPPAPYDKDEWRSFMKTVGIIKTVSKDQFLQFAKQLHSHCDEPITTETEHKSKALVRHLLKEQSDLLTGNFLDTVKHIRFILPHQMVKQQEQSKMVHKILPQLQQGKLIAYSGSVSSQHCLYVWSSCTMFDSSADPDNYKYDHNARERTVIAARLGIVKEPTLETITTHTENLCTALQKKLPESRRDESLKELLKQVFESIYKQLYDKKIQQKPQINQRLKNVALIFLPAENQLVRAEQIVVELPEGKLIKGHMYKAPNHFGKYFDLFLMLGAAKIVTANHYATILQTLKHQTKDTKLEPNELKVVQEATKYLFDCLSEEVKSKGPTLCVPTLYLLDKNCVLVDSSKLVVADNGILEKRVTSLSLNYFVGFSKLEITVLNEEELFDLLPTKYRPRILTHVVTETMTDDCRKNASAGRLAEEYKTIVRHRDFLEGVVRVISDQMKLARQKRLDQTSFAEMEENIVSLSIQEVKGLKTALVFEGKQVPNSEENCTCFLDTNSKPLKVYLNSSTKVYSFYKKVLHQRLAEAINKLTGLNLTTKLTLLEGMFDVSLGNIRNFLDKMMVTACAYVSSKEEDVVFPNPGTYVPTELHWMLDNSFSTFEVQEYVGLEIYDPLNEKTERPSDLKGPLYIYAKIISVISEGDLPIHGRYLIDIGEDEHKEVSALDLYKFCRIERGSSNELVIYSGPQSATDDSKEPSNKTPDAPPLDFETVLKEIRETLREAWKLDDEKKRDKIKKRLLLKWHPDKNRQNIDFCTRVFQRLQNYINTLENGGRLDEKTGTTDAGPKPRRSGFDQWFYEEMNRRSRQHQEDFESHRRRNFDFEDFFSHSRTGSTNFGGHRSAREEPDPQPEEARRWMRQAWVDLRVARHTLSMDTAANWVCFQCYMSCEKAAKALLYNADGKSGNSHRGDDLSMVVYSIKQSSIQRLLLELLQLVGSSNKMQNPAKLEYPTIPSEAYTPTTALEACRLTEEVLQKTDEIIG